MEPILARLKNREVLVADGAMGTMLMQRGLKTGECPEEMNLTQPEVLEEIARLYFEAGSDLIQTNTFGGSPLKLAGYGLDGKAEEINQSAVRSVQAAVNGQAYIYGSCGPTGRILKPYGDSDPEELSEAFTRQMRALVEAGVDLIGIETMTDLQEAAIAIKAARSVSSDIPVMATMTFDKIPRGFYTIMGTSIKDACAGLEEAGADIIGSNCGNGIENMICIAQEFREYSRLPIIIQSNAGLPEHKDGEIVYSETAEFFAEKVPELKAAGVSIIGGCCGTSPDYIRAMKSALK
jgi:5-methyltetrahydrofolate--homocysteine methyltransferase